MPCYAWGMTQEQNVETDADAIGLMLDREAAWVEFLDSEPSINGQSQIDADDAGQAGRVAEIEGRARRLPRIADSTSSCRPRAVARRGPTS